VHTILRTDVFDTWLRDLRDKTAKAAITARIVRAQAGNFGDSKPVGEGVSEMRIDVGSGYRVYYMRDGLAVYVLLVGGDKSTQTKDIRRAIALAKTLRASK
jgi:putative addiction module killer protein